MRTRGRELALGALCGTVIAIATPAVADAVAWGLPVLGLGGGSTGTTQVGPDTTALPASPPLFGANSWRNRRLPNTEPIDRHSAVYVAELRREVRTYGAWVNASRSSIPIST